MVPVLDLGDVSIVRVSSHTFIAQQVVGNNMHELTNSGAHVKCKAPKEMVKAEHCFYSWSKFY
jgi:hypothetical protein